MNRENKRKQFQNGYYKNHRCDDTFTCKHCGRVVVPIGAGTQHRNHCPNCLVSLHLDDEPGDRTADCGGQRKRPPDGRGGKAAVNVCGAARLHGRVRAPRLAKRHHKP